MAEEVERPVDQARLRADLTKKSARMKLALSACAGCSLCAESCFMFRSSGRNPQYMPSFKVLNSLGRLYRKRGKVTREQLEQMKSLLWHNCVLCERCYCPMGIDLPNMIAFARRLLRTQGVDGVYPDEPGAPEDDAAPAEQTEAAAGGATEERA